MKVTKVGIVPSSRIWLGSCQRCGSEAEAVEGELTRIRDTQRDGRFSWEKCPVCGAGGSEDAEGFGGMLFYPKKVVKTT